MYNFIYKKLVEIWAISYENVTLVYKPWYLVYFGVSWALEIEISYSVINFECLRCDGLDVSFLYVQLNLLKVRRNMGYFVVAWSHEIEISYSVNSVVCGPLHLNK